MNEFPQHDLPPFPAPATSRIASHRRTRMSFCLMATPHILASLGRNNPCRWRTENDRQPKTPLRRFTTDSPAITNRIWHPVPASEAGGPGGSHIVVRARQQVNCHYRPFRVINSDDSASRTAVSSCPFPGERINPQKELPSTPESSSRLALPPQVKVGSDACHRRTTHRFGRLRYRWSAW